MCERLFNRYFGTDIQCEKVKWRIFNKLIDKKLIKNFSLFK